MYHCYHYCISLYQFVSLRNEFNGNIMGTGKCAGSAPIQGVTPVFLSYSSRIEFQIIYQARRRFSRDQNATVSGDLKTVLSAY